MEASMHRLEKILNAGGMKKDITLIAYSGISLILSFFHLPIPVNAAWIAIILCGVPIILEAVIGLVTAFDIKADVLVSLALNPGDCRDSGSCHRRHDRCYRGGDAAYMRRDFVF